MKGTCEICGNEYDKAFEVILDGGRHVFDCFECAITGLAPICVQCHCRIIGHGVESEGDMFCGAHCAKVAGVEDATDRVDPRSPLNTPPTTHAPR